MYGYQIVCRQFPTSCHNILCPPLTIPLKQGIIDNADIKIVLRKVDDNTLELSVTKQTEPYQTSAERVTGLDLASGRVTKLKLYIDGSSREIKLDVDSFLKLTAPQLADSFSEIWFGGSPADCTWHQTDCGVSRTIYSAFVGSFHAVKLGEVKLEFDGISSNG